jgi:hypothetical protein
MISSLCPLQIGAIASIALIPVSRGTLTVFLVITHGATFSTSPNFLGVIFFHQSIGSPTQFRILQRYSSPTQTLNTRPVAATLSHCLRVV